MLKYLIGFLLLMGFIGGAYYFLGLPPDTIEEKTKTAEPIIIGFVGPLSGDSASYGIPIKNSVALAVKDLKTQGKSVEVIYEDGKCSGEDARTALNKLINIDKIKAVIGGICSGETLAMASLAEEKSVVLFSPSAASPDITNAGSFVFRNNPSDAYGGKALGEFLGKKYKKAALISENTDYAKTLRQVFLEKYSESGGEINLDEVFSPDAKEFKSIVAKFKNTTTTEAIFINPQTEQAAGQLVKELRGGKVQLPLFSHLLPGGVGFLEAAGKAAEGLIFTDVPALNISNARVAAFLEDYKKNFGAPASPDFYMGAAYDALGVLVQAAEKTGNDSVKIRDYLYNLPEYDGLIGKHSFDLNGDVVGIGVIFKQIKDGRVEDYQEPNEAATAASTATTTVQAGTSTTTSTKR